MHDEQKRQRALKMLADVPKYGSIAAIGRTLAVPTRTLARWKSSPDFQAALRSRMPHAPMETKSDGTTASECTGLPEDSETVITTVMRELHAIGTDPKVAPYARVGALSKLLDATIEHRTVAELRAQIAELRGR